MRIILIILFVFIELVAIPDISAKQVNIRVAIIQDAQDVRVTIKGAYDIIALYSSLSLVNSEQPLKYVLLKPAEYGIDVGNKPLKVFGVKIIPKAAKEIFINGCPFKGSVIIIRKANLRLLVINELDLEDYLKGVLFHEVSHLWPIETLKAQAVAARTFALYQIQQRQGFDFDVTSDIYSQVYGGSYSERKRCNLAVDLTKGIVLNCNGEVFPAYFHAVCGGKTEDASVLWRTDVAALKGVECNFCKISPHYYWKFQTPVRNIQDKLAASGIKVKDITKIEVSDFTKSDRAKSLKIFDSEGNFIIVSAKDFRQSLDPNIIRSTNFSVAISDGNAFINGKGWGHGVGLCQWGAFQMAAKGYNFEKILYTYYPGSKLERIK